MFQGVTDPMSMDASDLVDSLLDEQARRNSALDEGEIENLITDVQSVYPVEPIGLNGAETTSTTGYTAPHHWGDGQSFWGFVRWGN